MPRVAHSHKNRAIASRHPRINAIGNWILTPEEQAQQERQRAERLTERLRSLGVDPDNL